MDKTIKLVVAINELGEWTCWGGDSFTEKAMVAYSKENMEEKAGDNISIHYIEAVIPVPVSQTIKGFKTKENL